MDDLNGAVFKKNAWKWTTPGFPEANKKGLYFDKNLTGAGHSFMNETGFKLSKAFVAKQNPTFVVMSAWIAIKDKIEVSNYVNEWWGDMGPRFGFYIQDGQYCEMVLDFDCNVYGDWHETVKPNEWTYISNVMELDQLSGKDY